MKASDAIEQIIHEYYRATNMNGAFNSPHEGFAVIHEEFDELKAEVWKNGATRDINLMRKEAMQVAAMAFRFMVDCT
jgi:hypothetical protein